ncbi:hypothetical protein VPHD148_0119 [Vibrio phage D148]
MIKFFTNPCRVHGEVDHYVSNEQCAQCSRERSRAFRDVNRDKINVRRRERNDETD